MKPVLLVIDVYGGLALRDVTEQRRRPLHTDRANRKQITDPSVDLENKNSWIVASCLHQKFPDNWSPVCNYPVSGVFRTCHTQFSGEGTEP